MKVALGNVRRMQGYGAMGAGQPPKDPAPAGMRDRLRYSAGQAWRAETSAVYLGRAWRLKVRFKVPGLRADGTVKGEHSVRWFFTRLIVGVVSCVIVVSTIVFLLIWIAIQIVTLFMEGDPEGISVGLHRHVTVTAPTPAGQAVLAGRGLARSRGDVWVVGSAHSAAVVQVVRGREEAAWMGAGAGYPMFAIQEQALYWSDTSGIALELPPGERQLFRA